MQFLFDGYVLDIGRRELRLDTELVALEPLVFDLLVYLVVNRDRVVSKTDVLDTVWSGRSVSESALTTRIAAARRAIGDSGEAQKLIRTIARKGFRFVGAVREEKGIADDKVVTPLARLAEMSPLALADKPSIAVLPFANMSSDPDQEYFADGMADDIITELSRSRSFFVTARNSSFTYKGHSVDAKEVARSLGVRYVVQGSVRRSGDRVRIGAQLIDAETGNHIWAERYDRALADVFAVQDVVTAAIASAIVPAVSNVEQQRALRRPPENLFAWEAYQCGLWYMRRCNAGDNTRAQEFFRRAIALDASFASAHTSLAMAVMMQGVAYGALQLDEVVRLAGEQALEAVTIDPNDADAQAVLAFVLWTSGNFEEAWERAALAITSNSNSPWANGCRGALLIFSGYPLEGRTAVLTALRLSPLDPRDAHLRGQIAISHYFECDYAGAVEMAKSAMSHHPEHPLAYRWLAAALGQLDRADEARNALRKAIQVSPESFDVYTRSRPAWFRREDYQHMLDGLRKAGWHPPH